MNANEKFIAADAHVDAAAIAPLPNSRKVYVAGSRADIRVPMREISQSPACNEANPRTSRSSRSTAASPPSGAGARDAGPCWACSPSLRPPRVRGLWRGRASSTCRR